jgi:hypothetical protein
LSKPRRCAYYVLDTETSQSLTTIHRHFHTPTSLRPRHFDSHSHFSLPFLVLETQKLEPSRTKKPLPTVGRETTKTACIVGLWSSSNEQAEEDVPCPSMGVSPGGSEVRVPSDPGSPPCNGVVGRDGQAGGWIMPSSSGDWIDSPHPTAKYAKLSGYIPPLCS